MGKMSAEIVDPENLWSLKIFSFFQALVLRKLRTVITEFEATVHRIKTNVHRESISANFKIYPHTYIFDLLIYWSS